MCYSLLVKKTKAEKKLADLRKGLRLEQDGRENKQSTVYRLQTTGDDQLSTIGYTNQKIPAQSQNQSLYIYPVQLIRKDLTKTLVLCILAISLELGLYIMLEKPGLLPF